MNAMLIQAAAAAGEPHLTFSSILSDIPHDPAAIAVYVLTIVAVGWVVVAGRRKGSGSSQRPAGQ